MSIKIPKLKGENPIGISDKQQLAHLNTQNIIESKIKQAVDTAPTYTPKTFNEQIVLYKNGATIRLYVHLDGDWSYSALT